jgi:hypothetical protein
VAIATFVVVGEITHGVDPVANAALVADTYAPFLIGWAVASFAAGLYAGPGRLTRRGVLIRTVPAWVAAALIAQGLRATELFHGDAAVTFFLVSCLVGGTLLVAWRAVAPTLLDR